jgi:carotenoid 1,2-hydratase
VFSPYYARARKNTQGDPENHCALNVALYGVKRRWAMTERGATHVLRDEKKLMIGPSSMVWDDDDLLIEIREHCMPLPFALHGRVRLIPGQCYDAPVTLDTNNKHFWRAVAPQARVSVEFENPNLSWSGAAYHDMNWGEEPLEQGFKRWTWLRAKTSTGTQVLYDVERRDGSHLSFGRRFQDGRVIERDVPPAHDLRSGFWGMARTVNSDAKPQLISTLEDAPFYTRNHVEMTLDGARCEAFHESLSLDCFVSPMVQMMLPFRMPRRA